MSAWVPGLLSSWVRGLPLLGLLVDTITLPARTLLVFSPVTPEVG